MNRDEADQRERYLDMLIAKDEIRVVINDLARGTDRLDRDLMASCYWPDGYDDHNSFRGNGDDFADWVLSALSHFVSTHHFLGQCRIEVDGDVAHCETYCDAHHISGPDAEGKVIDMAMGLRYVDRFERRDGVWKIKKRVCAFDWAYYIDADRSWAFGDDFCVGARDKTDITYTWFDMAVDRQMIEFTPDDIEGVAQALGVVIERGAGWLNIEPIVGEVAMDEIRRTAAPAMVRMFSARGGKIPFGTFVPGDHRKGGLGQVGLEHSAGPRGLNQLRDAGVVLPTGWRMRQDHSKRGIVCDVPRDEAPAVIVRWMLDASVQLCEIDLTGWWTAVISLPK